MSSKAASPTATILRNSRFFSLPNPLPLPASEALGFQRNTRTSPTATLPWPVQQAITTTPAAHAQGDWGLKRPLPTRVTQRASTPIFKINAVDTRESITDYSSATDLSLTLQKIQELNLPVTVPPGRLGRAFNARYLDPFQSQLDNTDPRASADDKTVRRWKFKGPSITHISEHEFKAYIQRELKNRQFEFTSFLRQRAREVIALESRVNASTDALSNTELTQVSEQDIATRIRQWQHAFDHGSILYSLIVEFLDLPDMASPPTSLGSHTYARYEEPPPSTHPSAGISYLRSDAYLTNHPILGPQNQHAPIEARSLGHTQRLEPYVFTGTSHNRIGVAGVVAPDPSGVGGLRARSVSRDQAIESNSHDKAGSTIGVSVVGGNRLWVNPTKLQIDKNNRIKLETYNSDPTAIAIHTGQVSSVEKVLSTEPLSPKGTRSIKPNPGSGARRTSSPFFNTSSGDTTSDFMKNLAENIQSRPTKPYKSRY